jgi:hypothetical protein
MQCEALSNDGSLSQVMSVDVSVLNSGVYICKVNGGISQTMKKFIVVK